MASAEIIVRIKPDMELERKDGFTILMGDFFEKVEKFYKSGQNA